jgi:TatD DNase family protein
MILFDTHCHLTNCRFDDDRAAVLERARTAGCHRLLTVGTGCEDAEQALALTKAQPDLVMAAAGLDPFSCHQAGPSIDAAFTRLEHLLAGGGFAAVGECGLEYHHQVCPHPIQADHLERHCDLARRLKLPLILHVREAHQDLIPLLRRHQGLSGVIHSFSGGAAEARAYLDLGWHLSFNGTLTYPRNQALREAASLVPADRLLIETDAPYLPPVPHRGRRNEPSHLALVAEALAECRAERPDDLQAWTTRNACLLFSAPLPQGF